MKLSKALPVQFSLNTDYFSKLVHALQYLHQCNEVRRQRRQLAELPIERLIDLGLDAEQVKIETARGYFDLPRNLQQGNTTPCQVKF